MKKSELEHVIRAAKEITDFRLVRARLARKLIKLASVRRFIAVIEDPVFQKLMLNRLAIVVGTAIPDAPPQKRLRQDPSKLPQDALGRIAAIWIAKSGPKALGQAYAPVK